QLTAGAASNYSWSSGGMDASTTVSPEATTVYTVNASTTENNLTCDATNTVEVLVYPQPTVSATANSPKICINETATLTAQGDGELRWTGGSSNSVITIPAFNTLPIQYSVTL